MFQVRNIKEMVVGCLPTVVKGLGVFPTVSLVKHLFND